MRRHPDVAQHRSRADATEAADAADTVRVTPHPANPHATRLTLLIADVLVVAVVVFVVPMLWVGDLTLKLWGGLTRWTTNRWRC